jgi:hypothetical protein
MARTSSNSPAPAKEPGRLRQMVSVFNMTRRIDPSSLWYMIAGFVLPILVGVALALLLSPDNILGFVLYIISGVLGGVLIFLIILGRRAEKAAYSQIAGQPGAVGAVIKSGLRRSWVGSEMPEDTGCRLPRRRAWRRRAHRRRPEVTHAAHARG